MSKRHKQSWFPHQMTAPVQKPLQVMVTVFTGVERHAWVNPQLTAALMRMAYDPRIELSYAPVHAVHPVSVARNTAVEKVFLPSPCEMLVMFDNDVAPPENVVDAMLSMPKEAAIGILPYFVWLHDLQQPMVCFGQWKDGGMTTPSARLEPGWQEMGAGGTGCMFIRRRVFTSGKLQKPFFKIISDEYAGQKVSEDIYFTGLAAEAGFPTWTTPDYLCSHFHTIDLADVNEGVVKMLKAREDGKPRPETLGRSTPLSQWK